MTSGRAGSSFDVAAAQAVLVDASAQMHIPLGATELDALIAFVELLRRWNRTYNLTAVRDPGDMVIQHLVDCLACIAPLRREIAGLGAVRLLDVGSGGGLPAALIAIVCPQLAVTCIDAVGKKSAFVAQVAATLRLPNLQSRHGRVETQPAEPFDVVTSRAFATLERFTAWTKHLLAHNGKWMAMKGQVPMGEIAELSTTVHVFHVEPLVIPNLNAERCLVWMRLTNQIANTYSAPARGID